MRDKLLTFVVKHGKTVPIGVISNLSVDSVDDRLGGFERGIDVNDWPRHCLAQGVPFVSVPLLLAPLVLLVLLVLLLAPLVRLVVLVVLLAPLVLLVVLLVLLVLMRLRVRLLLDCSAEFDRVPQENDSIAQHRKCPGFTYVQ